MTSLTFYGGKFFSYQHYFIIIARGAGGVGRFYLLNLRRGADFIKGRSISAPPI